MGGKRRYTGQSGLACVWAIILEEQPLRGLDTVQRSRVLDIRAGNRTACSPAYQAVNKTRWAPAAGPGSERPEHLLQEEQRGASIRGPAGPLRDDAGFNVLHVSLALCWTKCGAGVRSSKSVSKRRQRRLSSSSLGTILLEERKGGQRVVKLRSIWLMVAPAAGREGDRSCAAAQGRHSFCSQNRSTTTVLLMEE
ncbi:hypothetical protein EYF80_034647 [Liparis tanakae]|uniref:Uncharacterized protein n=1 Tax=Liparis tanakae TaxID=230148 RepID=A0A4Z2GQS8_9TELE|nr:hypothetical protein EYF80_034647 [Liparis tanakae]